MYLLCAMSLAKWRKRVCVWHSECLLCSKEWHVGGKKWVAHKISAARVCLFLSLSFTAYNCKKKLPMKEKNCVYPWHRENGIFSIIIALIIQFHFSSCVNRIFQAHSLSFYLPLIESKPFFIQMQTCEIQTSGSGSNTTKKKPAASTVNTETESFWIFPLFEPNHRTGVWLVVILTRRQRLHNMIKPRAHPFILAWLRLEIEQHCRGI